ncbi:MAG: DUF3089 domain-containing protein [bacterium]|nr:DUF3089 domain-containing protein [bacterium]
MSERKLIPSDYSLASNWLVCPSLIEHPVDTIFLCPTCYRPDNPEAPVVCEIDDVGLRAAMARCDLLQASLFRQSTNVFVPVYRQCNAFGMGHMSQREILEVYEGYPRTDVFAALDYYFQKMNHERPFILAGHSQGSLMAMYALTVYFVRHPELYKRMVAAYVIGFGMFKALLQQNPHLKMAKGADDTGVIVSYNTEGPENSHAHNVVVPPGSVAINPLNWRTDETYAPISLNKGSLHIGDDGIPYLGLPLADAQINLERGTVICRSLPDPARYVSRHVSSFGPASFHSMDYSFYYANLQENVALRIDRFQLSS